jgi:hypothetical protein
MGDPLPFSANSLSRGLPYSCMSEAMAGGAGLDDVAVIGEPVDDGRVEAGVSIPAMKARVLRPLRTSPARTILPVRRSGASGGRVENAKRRTCTTQLSGGF